MDDKHDNKATNSDTNLKGKHLTERMIGAGLVTLLLPTLFVLVIVGFSLAFPWAPPVAALISLAALFLVEGLKTGAESFADSHMKERADKVIPQLSLVQKGFATAVAAVVILGISGQVDFVPTKEGPAFECRPTLDRSGEFTCHPIENEP